MKEKMKKFILGYLPGFITGIIVCGTVSVIAATYFPSNQTTYDNSNSGMSSTNVQGAIDELYNTCTAKPPATDTITDLLPSNADELYEDEHGDIRYYGATPNNYVSFNNELWRIIGVIDGKIKIIRNESIGNMPWDTSNSNNWNITSLKSYLNGDYYNSIDSTYRNMISEETYYLGGIGTTVIIPSAAYDLERGNNVYADNPTSTKQNIGLMYPSDYGYAAGSSCLSTTINTYSNNCKNNDYLYVGESEWLQTPYYKNRGIAMFISNIGNVGHSFNVIDMKYVVRPTLYLNTNVQITGGDGSQSNPFQISL